MNESNTYESKRRKSLMRHFLDGKLIARDKNIMSGAYTLRGTRLTVRNFRSMHRGGDSCAAIARNYNLPIGVVYFVIYIWRKP